MRVLLAVHQYFPQWIGGVELLVRGLARRLLRDGHDPIIVTYEESPSNCVADFTVNRSLHEDVPVFRIFYNLSCAKQPSLAEYNNEHIQRCFGDVLDETKPDVVNVVNAMKLSGSIIHAIKSRGTPIITTITDYWFICLRHTLLKPDGSLCTGPDERYKCLHCAAVTHGFATPQALEMPEPALSKLARRTQWGRSWIPTDRQSSFARDVGNVAQRTQTLLSFLQQSDRIVALAGFTRDQYIRYGVPKEKIALVMHGPEDSGLSLLKHQRAPRPEGALEIIAIATLAPFKGLHILAEAFAQVPELDGRLLLYGSPGPDAAYVEQLRKLSARDSRIHLAGTFAPEEIGAVLASASILAHPSIWYENDPQVIKQALLAGVPVVASDLGSLPEMIADIKGCTLLPPGDVSVWADWLRGLILHPPPPTVTAPDIPTMDDHYGQMLELYEELAGQ